ncbi:(2Fe-2S) ferredoxin domain-containing protein [Sulfurimonas sp. MAG313]|nr:(2Fe-2S) ferredoxin domain-containing protein [Sulfurimonas sp. MAG313]MDF1880089.1 (2Fe-2S) ferredoxin domain-containing protein [Sulfurimonas sp. MAG313]
MGMPQPSFYIFKCQQSAPPQMPGKPSCVTPESEDLMQFMAMSLMQKGLVGNVLPIQTGCLNRCNVGPIMLVEPGHVMYVQLTKEKITKIIDEHIIGGNIVEEYLIDEELWDTAISPVEQMKLMGK